MRSAGVIWITGLAGVGKTSLAQLVAQGLRERGRAVLLLDGDAVRAVLDTAGAGYAREERLAVARRLSRLAGLAAAQGLAVVVATISLFHIVQEENRARLPGYFEVLLECAAPRSDLYAAAAGPVVGRDLAAEFPRAPQLRLSNDGTPADLIALADRLIDAWLQHV